MVEEKKGRDKNQAVLKSLNERVTRGTPEAGKGQDP